MTVSNPLMEGGFALNLRLFLVDRSRDSNHFSAHRLSLSVKTGRDLFRIKI